MEHTQYGDVENLLTFPSERGNYTEEIMFMKPPYSEYITPVQRCYFGSKSKNEAVSVTSHGLHDWEVGGSNPGRSKRFYVL